MKKIAFNLSIIAFVFMSVIGIIYWTEADKELKILSSMIYQGEPMGEVKRLLETGELLHYNLEKSRIAVSSDVNMNTYKFIVLIKNDLVQEVEVQQSVNLFRIALRISLFLTLLLALFQASLALGLPLGEWAWGGFHKNLPKSLRISSGISTLILSIAIIALLSIQDLNILSVKLSVYIITGFTVLYMFSIFGNLASVSKKEKILMIPVSILLFLSYFTVAYTSF